MSKIGDCPLFKNKVIFRCVLFLSILYAIKGIYVANPLVLFDKENDYLFTNYLYLSLPYFALFFEFIYIKRKVLIILFITVYDFLITLGPIILIMFVFLFHDYDMETLFYGTIEMVMENIVYSILYFVNILVWLFSLAFVWILLRRTSKDKQALQVTREDNLG